MSLNTLKNVPPVKFYGKDGIKLRKVKKTSRVVETYVLRDLLNGPSLVWKTFNRQEEAMEWQRRCKGGLMTFAYETFGLGRRFLVAHPEVFWHYNVQREPGDRCTYEIIPEGTVSKIYLDLEFNKALNPSSDGELMVQGFIDILTLYLKKHFNVECFRESILDLESSSDSKFSRHIILNLPNHAFIDNKNVGNFIKKICTDLKNPDKSPDLSTVKLETIQSLFVADAKNRRVLFCDEGVYTRNRHFRCYQNTKKRKNCPLILSKSNIFKCDSELQYFLSSLITNVKSDVTILQYSSDNENGIYQRNRVTKSIGSDDISTSPYPLVDKFINDYVNPGRIYRSVYFSSSKTLVYDIVNNRFCGNILRQHKSNNVKYVVNIDSSRFYQKCHDWECRDYKSDEMPLPTELCNAIRSEEHLNGEDELGLFDIYGENISDIRDEIKTNKSKKRKLEHFPSFGLSDEEFLKIDVGI